MPVGTDFLTFATGGGANVEDQPSYQTDPQRQTGALPGIARSNFHNKATRQGSFVACAISTFVTQQINVYVPDDGDVQKYVDYFKQALSALFTGLLPDDPDLSLYLPKAGGTMTGDIQFTPGASIQLANNTWLRAKDSAGTPQNVLMRRTDGQIQISDGAYAYTIFGNTPVVTNARYWSCADTTGAAHPVVGILGDNNTYIQAFNNLYINSSNIWTNSSIIIPNSSWYYAKNAAAQPVAILGVNNQNDLYIGINAPRDTLIYAASGRSINLQNNTNCAGTFGAAGLYSSGVLDIAGFALLRGSLQVNGAANFYARINVNNSVGASITGDLQTNSIHVYGGTLFTDTGPNTLSGQTNLNNTQVYNGGSDPLHIVAPQGYSARIQYLVQNIRLWTVGVQPDGVFYINDESGSRNTLYIDLGGQVVCTGALYVAGNQTFIGSGTVYGNWTCNASMSCSGYLTSGLRGNFADVYSRGNVFISNDEWFYLGTKPDQKFLNFHPYRYLYWVRSNGELWWSSDNWAHVQWEFGGNPGSIWLLKNWQGPMAAKGFLTQGVYSRFLVEDTLRSVVDGDATEIIGALNPRRFRRKPRLQPRHDGGEPFFRDQEREEIGFLVDEVRAALPAAVVDVAPYPTGTDHLPRRNPKLPMPDPDDYPTQDLDTNAILAVAVRAIQEINERLARLEAAAA